MTEINYEERHASHPDDVKRYDTNQLRQHFLIEKIFEKNKILLTYSMYDRFVAGGAMPSEKPLPLHTIDPLKSNHFCDRREVGIINIGGEGTVTVDDEDYELSNKEGLYIGMGASSITFKSKSSTNSAVLYINSTPAHQSFPTTKIRLKDTIMLNLGKPEEANERQIIQYIVASGIRSCQLQMGITSLKTGSVWNTMPPHTHNRRMEVYLYIDLPDNQAISHFMGEPKETRHIWMTNRQAVISPPWSIHCASGTSNYSFVWGMAGENLDFTDMDVVHPLELR
ncbi:5-dehydro-4-deoxy-D-glucuronate isomerase [Fulvivirga sp. M361]|uniref:5-dehydro-4-deoxy-D-glucuronate isomerase n=1 Tax=Fulvivirga sp. M361 TaxID=2594266 RepID=UPI001179A1FA|nr:5-dehydro-4-deoxy-D-glucuronate isomerase [Fulvivirga sp. M361]TRX47323.1 5-dehydro-4-deoxy-D-glucuronate isomerase [Fulvivirga sp. M361]